MRKSAFTIILAAAGIFALNACAGPMPQPHEHHYCKTGDEGYYYHCQYRD